MFIKGVERKTAEGGTHTVTLAGFVSVGHDVRAIVVNERGRFDTALLSQLRLAPRQPIGGMPDGD